MVHDLSQPHDDPEAAPFDKPQDVAIRQAVDRHGKLCLEVQFIDAGNFVFAKIIPAEPALAMAEYMADIARASIAGVTIAREPPAPGAAPL